MLNRFNCTIKSLSSFKCVNKISFDNVQQISELSQASHSLVNDFKFKMYYELSMNKVGGFQLFIQFKRTNIYFKRILK